MESTPRRLSQEAKVLQVVWLSIGREKIGPIKAHSVYFPVAWVTLIPRLAPLGLAADEARKA